MKKATHDCMRMMAAMAAFAAVAVSLAGAPEFKIGTVGNPTAIHIQRTMKALEESTAENPATVRVLFYGQSIVAQGWTGVLMKMLKDKYSVSDSDYYGALLCGGDGEIDIDNILYQLSK